MSEIGHNSDGADVIQAERLILLIERIENLIVEKKGVLDDIKDVFMEGKAVGYDTKMMRIMIKERAMNSADRQEHEAILETYRIALGLI